MVHPTPNGLLGHCHSALRQQILDVTQAEGEPEVEPYRLMNDLGRETIPSVADLVHPRWATRPPRTLQAQSAVTMPAEVVAGGDEPEEVAHVEKQMANVWCGIERLIDSYAEGFVEKGEFEPRITGMKQRMSQLKERFEA